MNGDVHGYSRSASCAGAAKSEFVYEVGFHRLNEPNNLRSEDAERSIDV